MEFRCTFLVVRCGWGPGTVAISIQGFPDLSRAAGGDMACLWPATKVTAGVVSLLRNLSPRAQNCRNAA